MSLFKKLTKTDSNPQAHRYPTVPQNLSSTQHHALNTQTYGSTNGPTIVETRPRSGTDPATCLEVFRSHWTQVWAVMNGLNNNVAPGVGVQRSAQESVNTVIRYVDQMMLLLIEEEGEDGAQGPILQFMLEEDIVQKLLSWSSKQSQHIDRLKLHNLKMFEMIVTQSRQQVFVHKPIIRPMLQLLSSCEEHPDKNIEQHLVLVLGQLCVAVSQNTALLEVLFSASTDQGAAKFLIFSLLIPYIHREGSIGQQARDALLLIMALSAKNDNIGQYIAQNSDFCPVLATGLSGLYSSLPRKMNPSVDDWYCIRDEDVNKCTDLIMFLNSLEFCNAVIQVAHSLVAEQLLTFIYNGFLVPVMAPALHQNDIILNDVESDDGDDSLLNDDAVMTQSVTHNDTQQSSMEEVIAATAYLDLFIRKATEPNLIRVFVKFVVTEKYDDVNILDSLVARIHSNSRLCMVTMSLFKTLVELNCEDVMFQLVFKYLIPCTHVMVSQRRAVRDLDMYGKTAEKLLALRPNCCKTSSATSEPPVTPQSTTSSQAGTPQPSPRLPQSSPAINTPSQRKRRWFGKGSSQDQATNHRVDTTPSPSLTPPPTPPPPEPQEGCYFEYLDAARLKINECALACQCWTAAYDGENPSPDSLIQTNMVDSVTSDTNLSGIEPLADNQETGGSKGTVGDNKDVKDINKDASDLGETRKENSQEDSTRVLSDTNEVKDVNKDTSGEVESENVKEPDVSVEKDPVQKQQVCDIKVDMCNTEQSKEQTETSESTSAKSSQKPNHLPLQDTTKPCDNQPSVKPLRHSYAESSASEADSAISGVSAKSESHLTLDVRSESRSDSPLNDTFDNSDFNSFLMYLKRVETPVEFSESMEDCLNEIETLIENYKKSEHIRKPVAVRRQVSEILSPSTEKSLNEALLAESTSDLSKVNTPDDGPVTSADDFKMTKSISMDTMASSCGLTIPKSVSMDTMMTSTPAKPMVMPSANAPIFTPTRYNLGTPDVGPFLNTLLSKLEAMMQNSLYVNLLLTGLVTRLACYPQPLLRSFLLNHTLVFQPTVKSLLQVLGSVKHKVDAYAYTVKDFDTLMVKARQFLAWRETPVAPVTSLVNQTRGRSDSNLSIVPGQLREKKRTSSIRDFFTRTLTPQKQRAPQPRLQLLETGTGFRYIHRLPSPEENEENPIEALKAKNAVYCALVLEEFIKELAALSQEHAVLNVQLMPSQ